MWPLFNNLVTSSFMCCYFVIVNLSKWSSSVYTYKCISCLGIVCIIACRSCPNWLHLEISPQSYNIGLKGFHHFLIHLLLLLQLPNGFFGCFLCCNFGCILSHLLNCLRSLSITWSQSCLPLFPLASLWHHPTSAPESLWVPFLLSSPQLQPGKNSVLTRPETWGTESPQHSYFPRLVPTFRTSYIFILTSFLVPSLHSSSPHLLNIPKWSKMDISWHVHEISTCLSIFFIAIRIMRSQAKVPPQPRWRHSCPCVAPILSAPKWFLPPSHGSVPTPSWPQPS